MSKNVDIMTKPESRRILLTEKNWLTQIIAAVELFFYNKILISNDKWREPESVGPQAYKDHTSIWSHATGGVHRHF